MIVRNLRALLLAAALLGRLAAANTLHLHGRVYDASSSRGLRGIEVSDGRTIVVTGDQGNFAIDADPRAIVFVIKPTGWAPPQDADHRPQFFARPPYDKDSPILFALHRHEEEQTFRVLVLTDTQPANDTEVGYLDRTISQPLAEKSDCSFGVVLGDITFNRHSLYPAISASLGKIGIPLYCLPGNHDLDYIASDDRSSKASFEAVYGPSTYAFWAGGVLFVAFDDVRFLGGPRFIGGLRSDQFEFFQRLMQLTPRSDRVVVMLHIPLFSPNPSHAETFRWPDRARLFSLLAGHANALILSSHTHYQRHVFHGAADGWNAATPLHEYNVAAACGGFWGGPKDAAGIPVSTMWDGTPAGYAIAEFAPARVRLDYFPARLPADDQMKLHVPAALAPRQGYVTFYANVFNASENWTIEARIDDRGWLPMRAVLGWDPSYAEAYLAQDRGPRPGPVPRLPDPVICYHLYSAYMPPDLEIGDHTVFVRANDPYGKTFTASQAFRVEKP